MAAELNVHLEEDEEGFQVAPLHKGEPIDAAAFVKLSARKRRQIQKEMVAFQEHMDKAAHDKRQQERHHNRRLQAAEVKAIKSVVEGLVSEVSAWYVADNEPVAQYLTDVTKHILEHHRCFLVGEDAEEGESEETAAETLGLYQVNVLVDRSDEEGAPVVMERVPTPANLCGCLEYRTTKGGLATDHTLIRAGALHKANGGYLLLQLSDVLNQENGWESLKGALRHREVRIESSAGVVEGRQRIAGTMKPKTLPLDLKVVLIGGPDYYYYLKMEDEDFDRLFKIKAEFERAMPRTRKNVARMARVLGRVSREEFAGSRAAFDRADRNGDGVISKRDG